MQVNVLSVARFIIETILDTSEGRNASMNILNIPYLNATNEELKDHGYEITAEVASPPDGCLRCGSDELSKYGTKRQVFMDLPKFGKRVGIIVNRQRYRCKDCGFTFFEPLWGIDDDHMCTVRFVEYVQEHSLRRTFTSIADELGISEGTVRNIFNEYVDFLEAQHEFETPRWMGIDEIHIIGKPRGVITNVEDNTLLDLLIDRNKETIIGYMSNIPDRSRIEVVTMDMWKPYKDAVYQTLPNAEVVVDKFHVVRMANQAVEAIRKQIRKELDTKQRRQLKNDRFLMLKRRHDLKPMEQLILQSWTLNFPHLRQAYELKEGFYEIWEAEDAYEASHLYLTWKATIPQEMKSAFNDLVRAYDNWHHEINNYFTHRVTNAYTESLNGLTRVVNRMGRGYSFKALRAKMLYSEGIHKKAKTNYRKAMQMGNMMEMYGRHDDMVEVNLGVDISTLVKRIEEGSL